MLSCYGEAATTNFKTASIIWNIILLNDSGSNSTRLLWGVKVGDGEFAISS